jgi:hypothetical protein
LLKINITVKSNIIPVGGRVICENCGAKVKKGEKYCPKCGMELLVSNYKPLKKRYLKGDYGDKHDYRDHKTSKRQYSDSYEDSGFNQEYEGSRYESSRDGNRRYRDSQYKHPEYKNSRYKGSRYQSGYTEEYDDPYYYEEETKKAGLWGTVVLLLIVALLVGLVVGFIVFSTKMIPGMS